MSGLHWSASSPTFFCLLGCLFSCSPVYLIHVEQVRIVRCSTDCFTKTIKKNIEKLKQKSAETLAGSLMRNVRKTLRESCWKTLGISHLLWASEFMHWVQCFVTVVGKAPTSPLLGQWGLSLEFAGLPHCFFLQDSLEPWIYVLLLQINWFASAFFLIGTALTEQDGKLLQDL